MRNLKILLELFEEEKNKICLSLLEVTFRVAKQGRESLTNYRHRPRRFFGFNSGRLFKTYWKKFFSLGYSGRRYWSEGNLEDKFRNQNFGE